MKTFNQFSKEIVNFISVNEQNITKDHPHENVRDGVDEEICETAAAGLAAKASKSGISIGTLRKVYRRGVAAWNSGHRPGTTPQQWGMARVNSYITKGKGTYGGAEKDLHEGDTSKLPRVAKDKESDLPKKYVAGLSKETAKKRALHFDKADKLSDRDPRAYTPAPGDATAKTKESKHTKKYRAMFGEEMDEEVLEACWDGYKQIGVKKKGTKMVPNCVPEAQNPAQQAAIAIAMKKAGKKPKNEEVDLIITERGADSKGYYRSTESGAGLTRKGAKHFGIQTAVTGKVKRGSSAAKRRKSFCARMSGMPGPMKDEKGRPTRKAASLRRWRCPL